MLVDAFLVILRLLLLQVLYILNNNLDDAGLDLNFTEEEYDRSTHSSIVCELKEGGKDIIVTEKNKMEYLLLLAQWKLENRIANKVKEFRRGFSRLVIFACVIIVVVVVTYVYGVDVVSFFYLFFSYLILFYFLMP